QGASAREAAEESRHRAVVEDFADGAGDQGGDGEDGDLVELLFGGKREGVGDHDLGDTAVLEAFGGRVGQDRVGGGDDHVGGARVVQGVGGLADRPAGVDHVVDDQ